MKTTHFFWGGLILIMLATVLAFTSVDREIIALSPTPGQAQTIRMESAQVHRQEFVVYADNVSAVSLYLKPLQQNLPDASISGEIITSDTTHSFTLPAVFLDPDIPAQINISPPLQITSEERIAIQLTAPKELSGKVGLQLRKQDETFSAEDVTYVISGEQQSDPLAYHVYTRNKPLFTLQLAGVAATAAIYLLFLGAGISERLRNAISILLLVLLYSLPLILAGAFSLLLFAAQCATAVGIASLLRRRKVSSIAVFVGVILATLTSWWAVHLLAPDSTFFTLSLKDALVDPNQTVVSHASGAYLGIVGVFLAGVGAVTNGRRYWYVLAIAALTAFLGIAVTPHIIIVLVLTLAWLAAFGTESMYAFLGKQSKLVQILMWALALIVLIDLYTVGTTTLQSILLQ